MPVAISVSATNDTARRIHALWEEASRFESRPSMAALAYPPHITLAVYDHLDHDCLRAALPWPSKAPPRSASRSIASGGSTARRSCCGRRQSKATPWLERIQWFMALSIRSCADPSTNPAHGCRTARWRPRSSRAAGMTRSRSHVAPSRHSTFFSTRLTSSPFRRSRSFKATGSPRNTRAETVFPSNNEWLTDAASAKGTYTHGPWEQGVGSAQSTQASSATRSGLLRSAPRAAQLVASEARHVSKESRRASCAYRCAHGGFGASRRQCGQDVGADGRGCAAGFSVHWRGGAEPDRQGAPRQQVERRAAPRRLQRSARQAWIEKPAGRLLATLALNSLCVVRAENRRPLGPQRSTIRRRRGGRRPILMRLDRNSGTWSVSVSPR